MNPTVQVPPIPREAVPWGVESLAGRQAVEAAWSGVFKAGVEAGKIQSEVTYAKGIFHASAFWLSLFLITIGAAALARGRGNAR